MATQLKPVSSSVEIRASAAAIFALLADPHRHQMLDGSGSVVGCVTAVTPLAVEAHFEMAMKLFGVCYRSSNRIVEFEPPSRIAWRTTPVSRFLGLFFGGQTWRFDIQSTDAGSLVTEVWDPTTIDGSALATRLAGFSGMNAAAITASLNRLRDTVEMAG